MHRHDSGWTQAETRTLVGHKVYARKIFVAKLLPDLKTAKNSDSEFADHDGHSS